MSNGLLNDTQPATDDRSGSHWRDWEKGCLIEGLSSGRAIEDIASQLGRSNDAVRREFDRLLNGQTDCPDGYSDLLADLQKRLLPRGCKTADPFGEQYTTISTRLNALEREIRDQAALGRMRLALLVASGSVPARIVHKALGPRNARGVLNLAETLKEAHR